VAMPGLRIELAGRTLAPPDTPPVQMLGGHRLFERVRSAIYELIPAQRKAGLSPSGDMVNVPLLSVDELMLYLTRIRVALYTEKVGFDLDDNLLMVVSAIRDSTLTWFDGCCLACMHERGAKAAGQVTCTGHEHEAGVDDVVESIIQGE
jgi:hypothetical protein